MTLELITEILQLGLPTGLIIVGVAWVVLEGWPYWKERDALRADREHERDMAAIASQNLQSTALNALAKAVADCPLKPPTS